MSRGRASVMAGMIHGRVDWVAEREREIGIYMKHHAEEKQGSTRCILRGTEVEKLIVNKQVQKGMSITVHGEYAARAFRRRDNGAETGELLCTPQRIVLESALEHRSRGALYASLKGVVMSWDPGFLQVKTYFNAGSHGINDSFTVSVSLKNWCNCMKPEARAQFIAAIKSGREYTANGIADVQCYKTRDGVLVPAIYLLPTDFSLQS